MAVGLTLASGYGYDIAMARQPTLVQLTNELLTLLDRRALATGCSRSELIREAVTTYLADEQNAAVDARIVEGYQRVPETAEDVAWAESALRDSIAEEPW